MGMGLGLGLGLGWGWGGTYNHCPEYCRWFCHARSGRRAAGCMSSKEDGMRRCLPWPSPYNCHSASQQSPCTERARGPLPLPP
jgi:hypothetical protein